MYAIVLNEPDEGAWKRISTEWLRHYFVNDTVALIACNDPVSLTGEIAAKVGMNAKFGVLGIVMEVGSNNGYSH